MNTRTAIWLVALVALPHREAYSNESSLSSQDVAFLKAGPTESIYSSDNVDKLIEKISPSQKLDLRMFNTKYGDSLAYHLQNVIVVGFKVTKINDQEFTITGCRPHSCPEKGFIWINTEENKAVAGIIHYLIGDSIYFPRLLVFSKDYRPETVPSRAIQQMEKWLKDWSEETKEFVQHHKPDYREKDYTLGEIRYIDRTGKISTPCHVGPCSPTSVLGMATSK